MVLGFRDLVRGHGRAVFFSRTTVGGQEVARAVDTFPRMQAETEQNLPLEEVSSGKANGVRGVAPRADNLIDGSGHGYVGCLQGGVPHKQYALPDGALATCLNRSCRKRQQAIDAQRCCLARRRRMTSMLLSRP